jgi:tetratricopeptide (TPR) repeat protein
MRRALSSAAIAVACLSTACASAPPPPAAEPHTSGPTPPGPDDDARFQEALALFTRHDRAGDWSPPVCAATVGALLGSGVRGSPVPTYDAALVEQRCGRHDEARRLLSSALETSPTFYPARAALALYTAATPGGLDAAIRDLDRAVRDSRYGSVEALVALATLQMRRGSATADDEGASDADRALRNLGRALAINDRYMPALDQLALLHLAQARRAAAGPSGKKGASQALELAALVCSQGIAKDPRHAPLHNTAGLVEVELGNFSRAAAEFGEARRLDPRFVEAHMNFAAVNLQFRGFALAEEAYRAVLALRPDDYDAQIGLALALRGQLGVAADPAQLEAADKLLAAAEKVAPDRPEAYYNQAILVQEYLSRSDDKKKTLAELSRAKGLYGQFLEKSDKSPAFGEARKRAKERMAEIDDMVRFLASAGP